MNSLKIGNKYSIHSYKHDGTLHRSWDEAVLLDIFDDYLVCGNDKTVVTESDGRTWKTKELAVLYFYKDKWFNIIGQNKEDGIYVDCTLGYAGHSSEILKRIKDGHLYAFDQDKIAIAAANEKLKNISSNYTIIKSNYKPSKKQIIIFYFTLYLLFFNNFLTNLFLNSIF